MTKIHATIIFKNGETGAIQVAVKKDKKKFQITTAGTKEEHEFICVGKVSVLKTENCKTV